jgi:hypothetical protein
MARRPFNDAANAPLVQHQTVKHGRRKSFFTREGHIKGICRDNFIARVPNGFGSANQGCIFTLCAGKGQFCRRQPCRFANPRHQSRAIILLRLYRVHAKAPLNCAFESDFFAPCCNHRGKSEWLRPARHVTQPFQVSGVALS